MFTSKLLPRVSLLHRATFFHGEIVSGRARPAVAARRSSLDKTRRCYSTAADNRCPPRWVQLEPELDEALVPRKLSVSPLESWLSLRYALPPESARPEEKVLPPASVSVLEDEGGAAATTPLRCKNVLEIRRRKMNHHKYKKLLKRTKFLRRRVRESRGRKKQKRFEEDLKRIWRRAGLKKPPEGWSAPKLFIKQYGNKRD
ncbi:aurora kinase A-interacting protein [Syngnathoides biaculeatus]|uniref:aurora kinase A-interacting protein n=1 Tax=Syngnathoides biaculeatus TaxID=300417 RepID=UPI002ADD5F13|nr:aurora kinase A-interacting protein [Syngnathoides biaculeatus]XP_061703676.1 aurora kinase A-interacting protein [Syngnathoides biaculeatus]XP_061703685.1 aurora kinase A-interacting protein [Syngnathoides biaculeatus]XP_061703694.1 aurora kinase A-interacting protein [Syngnathoides biaculeatus]